MKQSGSLTRRREDAKVTLEQVSGAAALLPMIAATPMTLSLTHHSSLITHRRCGVAAMRGARV